MPFGVSIVEDVTVDPVTGRAPGEGERIGAPVPIAEKTEEVGMDVSTCKHHNRPFVPLPPTTLQGYIGNTDRLRLSTSKTPTPINDTVDLAYDYVFLEHLSRLRVDLVLGRDNSPQVYRWLARPTRVKSALTPENYGLLRGLWDEWFLGWGWWFRAHLRPPHPASGDSGRTRRCAFVAESAASGPGLSPGSPW